ncbi:MAG: Na+/H+ antiporter subunit E [Deltaproteobacteria bacterium]|nr:Na+/H+ antiporter subunit E [Deltaproteobacteria bacterium]
MTPVISRIRWILILAGFWCMLQGSLSAGQFLIGLAVGAFTLFVVATPNKTLKRRIRLFPLIRLILHQMVDLVRSSVRVTFDVLTPTARARPRILAVPVAQLDHVGVTVLANGITLTPGSLTLDTNEDGTVLYVHDMYAEDADKVRAAVSMELASLVRDAFPCEPPGGDA